MKATTAANFLVYMLSDACDDLTNMKINKLLYYAQGYHFRQFGAPLFEDDIEAWERGPVIASVYEKYKRFGNQPVEGWNEDELSEISEATSDMFVNLVREYGKMSADELSDMTHEAGAPWSQVYTGPDSHDKIPLNSIKDYFTGNGVQDLKPFEMAVSENDFVGYRDKDGYLVLPKEWND